MITSLLWVTSPILWSLLGGLVLHRSCLLSQRAGSSSSRLILIPQVKFSSPLPLEDSLKIPGRRCQMGVVCSQSNGKFLLSNLILPQCKIRAKKYVQAAIGWLVVPSSAR